MLHILHIVCCIKKVFYSKNVFFKNFLVQEGQDHSESFGAGCVKGKYNIILSYNIYQKNYKFKY